MRLHKLLFGLVVILAAFQGAAEDFVVVCPIEGMIDDGIRVFVDRAVREAKDAKAIIFVIDTPGGRVDSAIEISKSILDAPCPTIAYPVGMGAISAGALISFSCKHIVMAPEANIGAATPVIPTAEGMQPTSEKEVSFMRAKMRALAEKNGHNPAIAEAMVDKDIELRARQEADGRWMVYKGAEPPASPGVPPVSPAQKPNAPAPPQDPKAVAEKVVDGMVKDLLGKDPAPLPAAQPEHDTAATAPAAPSDPGDGSTLVDRSDKLLTMTPSEALKYGVIAATPASVEEALNHFGYMAVSQRHLEMNWSEALFRWLTSPLISGLLLMIGIGGIYFEIKNPGLGVPFIVGLLCLGLFFGSHLVIGLADWIDILLVIVGLILIVLEIFVVPGFGGIGVAGILCFFAGLYLSLTRVTVPEYSWEYARLQDAFTSLIVASSSFLVLVYVLWKLFPHTPLFGRLVLAHAQDTSAGYIVQTEAQEESAIGQRGVATTMLRPAGRGRFGDKTYSVVTRGDYLEPGAPLVIIQADGNRYVVEKAGNDEVLQKMKPGESESSEQNPDGSGS